MNFESPSPHPSPALFRASARLRFHPPLIVACELASLCYTPDVKLKQYLASLAVCGVLTLIAVSLAPLVRGIDRWNSERRPTIAPRYRWQVTNHVFTMKFGTNIVQADVDKVYTITNIR